MRNARFDRWRQAAHRKLGEQLFRRARADFEAGTTGDVQGHVYVAKALALLIILTPVAVGLVGLLLMSFNFPSVIPLVIGGVLIACALYVYPWPAKLADGGFRREELPELFALTDEIGARIDAEPLTLIYLTDEFNAGYSEMRGERIMLVGFALWVVLTPEERVALIAHELSHQVNGDISRSGILGYGLHALQRWYDLFGETEIVAHDGYLLREREGSEVFADGIMGMMRGVVEAIWAVLIRLLFVDSQRAEYLADALSTRPGGVAPTRQLLSKLALLPLIEAELRGLVPSYVPNGTAFYDRIAASVIEADEGQRQPLFDKMVAEAHCVDATHPPTFQRIAFLSDVNEPSAGAVIYDPKIDAELASHIECSGRDILNGLQEQ